MYENGKLQTQIKLQIWQGKSKIASVLDYAIKHKEARIKVVIAYECTYTKTKKQTNKNPKEHK